MWDATAHRSPADAAREHHGNRRPPEGMRWLREGAEFQMPGRKVREGGRAPDALRRLATSGDKFEQGAECTVLAIHLEA